MTNVYACVSIPVSEAQSARLFVKTHWFRSLRCARDRRGEKVDRVRSNSIVVALPRRCLWSPPLQGDQGWKRRARRLGEGTAEHDGAESRVVWETEDVIGRLLGDGGQGEK